MKQDAQYLCYWLENQEPCMLVLCVTPAKCILYIYKNAIYFPWLDTSTDTSFNLRVFSA